MIKINTFSMPCSKLIAYFISKLKYIFFHIFFHWPIFGSRKNAICLLIFLRTFSMELKYPENIKEIINEIYYRFS